jgi:hypothetical protein
MRKTDVMCLPYVLGLVLCFGAFAVCFVRCVLSRYPFSLFNRIFQSTWFHRGDVARYFVLWIWGPLAYLRCPPATDSLVRLVYIVRMQYLQYFKFQSLCICLHVLEPDTSTFRNKPHKIGCGEVVYQQLGNYPQQTTSTTLTSKSQMAIWDRGFRHQLPHPYLKNPQHLNLDISSITTSQYPPKPVPRQKTRRIGTLTFTKKPLFLRTKMARA